MEEIFEKIKFNDNGLIPAIIQDSITNEVLMLAYMNEESIRKTMETNKTWFYSRRRKKLWNKGETSGNFQIIEKIILDCDGDTLLVQVKQIGYSCHTGERSCFFTTLLNNTENNVKENIVRELYNVILERKRFPKDGSYTSYLFEKGLDKILKKIGEEASEIIISAKNNNNKETIYEIADFIYHLLVLMVEQKIKIEDVLMELSLRKK